MNQQSVLKAGAGGAIVLAIVVEIMGIAAITNFTLYYDGDCSYSMTQILTCGNKSIGTCLDLDTSDCQTVTKWIQYMYVAISVPITWMIIFAIGQCSRKTCGCSTTSCWPKCNYIVHTLALCISALGVFIIAGQIKSANMKGVYGTLQFTSNVPAIYIAIGVLHLIQVIINIALYKRLFDFLEGKQTAPQSAKYVQNPTYTNVQMRSSVQGKRQTAITVSTGKPTM